jgi:hypothetical protein
MRKIASMLLAIVLIIGLPLGVTANTVDNADKITGFGARSFISRARDLEDITIRPGDIIRIPFTADMFTWSSGKKYTDITVDEDYTGDQASVITTSTGRKYISHVVSKSQLSRNKVKVHVRRSKGSSIFEGVTLDEDAFTAIDTKNKTAYIKLQAKKELTNLNEREFEIEFYISIDGTRSKEIITVSGTLEPNTVGTGNSIEYLDISDGSVIEADANLRNVTIQIGENVYIQSRLTKGRKYYAVAKDSDLDKISTENFRKYDIVSGYNLTYIGFSETAANVRITGLGAVYYVYDGDFGYLGTTRDSLPLKKSYIVAEKKIAPIPAVAPPTTTKPPALNSNGEAIDKLPTAPPTISKPK